MENKIDGVWRRVNVANVNADQFEDWSLTDGYLYILQTEAGIDGYDTLSYGTYAVSQKLFKRYLLIEDQSTASFNNEWTIDKLTKNQLILYKDNGGLEYREFTKK
jgi:hypothetical protein